ncbi:hypothetical protein L6164_037063 [Bauhinia variegata]|uniref:Uncharacterized protein n=1 Tax=Bauhinia variegata TaxID=167791 RepID=A0ACB9KJQ4_BAUVA|nr:hypothetical protein L6164_037063 [Bauhinia variegata]
MTSAASYRLKIVFVGTSKAREFPQIETITEEKLSYFLPDDSAVCFFWKRLESILYSKSKQNQTEKDDQLMSDLMSLHTYDVYASIQIGVQQMV